MGDEQARTPHIDKLASEGVIMDNTFANTPVCCPARSILLTGQYCHRNGMVANDLRLRESSVSFAKELKKGGSVNLTGFGSFEVRKRAAREGRNPQTGATIKIKASKVPAFRPGKGFKDIVNKGK